MPEPGADGEPGAEEIAAALAALRLYRARHGARQATESRWLMVARAESVAPPSPPATWSTTGWPQ
ncbi:MAG TPA: acyl-CoA carboxylase subunit epsilon [Chloroflexota bacterium]|nr:acyl-CoA carboxylase subunit epsilon [Chloroflexota bacterium]